MPPKKCITWFAYHWHTKESWREELSADPHEWEKVWEQMLRAAEEDGTAGRSKHIDEEGTVWLLEKFEMARESAEAMPHE